MADARHSPEVGFERALAWGGLGGGAAAKHCAAVALMGLKQYGEAARRLQELADEVVARPAFKAELLGQAGQAWLLAADLAKADAVLTTALTLNPTSVELLIDRAQVAAEQGAYREAANDLSKALSVEENRADALVFRASAYRHLKQMSDADRDLWRALILAPDDPAALLERGMLARLQGEDQAARRDWLRVIEVAPGRPVAGLARINLQKMDGPGSDAPR